MKQAHNNARRRGCLPSQINDWFGAAKKTLLSNANKLLQDMQEFDKDNIPDKVIAVRREDNNKPTTTKHISSRDCSEHGGMGLEYMTAVRVAALELAGATG